MHRLSLPLALLFAAFVVGGCGNAASSAPGGGGSGAAACADSTNPGTVAVAIADSAFDPQTVTAAVGDVVEWTNEDGFSHSAVITGTGCATDTLGSGASGAIVFTAAGSYPYVCGIHSNMTGTITVQ